jgi:murein DD-endopeptidase MepM/ murein hydrolase activator NlpD
LFVLALIGRRAPAGALDLVFPLRGGTFIVGQGGASKIVNQHFGHASQRYALDVLMLNGAGVRARWFYPGALDRYAAWDAEVVSPCDGVVAAAVDQFPDLPPPWRDPAHPAGNHVAIESGGATVYLAHLRRGSVAVRAGDRVRAGQPVGRVGNSGNTTEPHLHIHAETGPYPGRFSGRPAIPITFGGRFLARNDRVAA